MSLGISHVILDEPAFKTKHQIIILYSHHAVAYTNSFFNPRLTLPSGIVHFFPGISPANPL